MAADDVTNNIRLALPSGGGKSTLLKIALRLLAPHSGAYSLGGANALAAPVDAVRRRLGWVPQVGRCRLRVSKPVLKAPMVSALDATI